MPWCIEMSKVTIRAYVECSKIDCPSGSGKLDQKLNGLHKNNAKPEIIYFSFGIPNKCYGLWVCGGFWVEHNF